MEQSGASWHEWRGRGIGSSDSAAIMGKSPYMSTYELLVEKSGVIFKEFEENEAMRFGKIFEENARAHVELEHGKDYPAIVAEHADHPFLRASLDGWCEETREFLEIKYIGKEKLEQADLGKIPEHYFIQMQHQFLVTGAMRAFYVCYTLTKERKQLDQVRILETLPDYEFIEKVLLPAEIRFWNLVESISSLKKNQVKIKKAAFVNLMKEGV